MGVGISEAGKLGAAVAAVGVASRMIGDEKDQAIKQGQAAADANAETLKEQEDVSSKIGAKELELDNLNVQAAGLNRNDLNPMEKIQQGIVMNDIQAAEEAMKQLQIKQTAIAGRLQRQKVAMERGRRWGGNY